MGLILLQVTPLVSEFLPKIQLGLSESHFIIIIISGKVRAKHVVVCVHDDHGIAFGRLKIIKWLHLVSGSIPSRDKS